MTPHEDSGYPVICPWCQEHPTRLTARGDALMCSSRVRGPDGTWDGCNFRQMLPEGFRTLSRADSGAQCPLCATGRLRLTRADNALMCSSRHQDASGTWVGCNYRRRIPPPAQWENKPLSREIPPTPIPIPPVNARPTRSPYFNPDTYEDFLRAVQRSGLSWAQVASLCEQHDLRPVCTGPDSAKDLDPTCLGILAGIIRAQFGSVR